MTVNTEFLIRCVNTLDSAFTQLRSRGQDDELYDIFRAASVKEFEIVLEQSGSLLKRRLRPYFASNRQADRLTFKDVFRHAVVKIAEVITDTLESAGYTTDDVDWFVPHQANLRIIKATAKRLGLPMERVVLTVKDHGNTSAASIPMAFDTAVRDGRIKRGDLVLLEAFGGGFT